MYLVDALFGVLAIIGILAFLIAIVGGLVALVLTKGWIFNDPIDDYDEWEEK